MTTFEPEFDSILAFTRGDKADAEQLRRALVAIRDHLGDGRLAADVEAVLSGHRTLRELTRQPSLQEAMGRAMDQFASEWSALGPAERADLARRGQQATGELRDELGLPPESDPAPIGEFGPALTQPE